MSRPVFLTSAAGTAAVGGRIHLDGDEGRHAVAVMRLRQGEEIGLTDGAGTLVVASVEETGKSDLQARVRWVERVPQPIPHVTVVQGLPKGDRGELAVEMLTEVGVDRIVPWAARRSVAVWRGDRAERSLEKWRRTARAATKQSRRAWVPEVCPPATEDEVAALLDAADLAVVLHEDADQPLAGVDVETAGSIVVVVGPEGGIDDAELDRFGRDRAARLGESVLRTSTAGVVAVAALLSRTPRWGISRR